MNKQVALTRTATGPQMPVLRRNLDIEGLEDLTIEEDLILPRWRMVQYSSTIEGEPGQFNNNLTGELRNQLNLVVLKVTPSRARFDEDRNLVCMSRNGHFSTGGKPCLGCQYAQWGEDGEPPACSRGYTLVCLNPQDDSLCLMGALRTSVPSVKRYNSLLAYKKRSPFCFVTRFTAQDTVGPKGKYFVLDIKLLGENAPDKLQEYRQQYLALAHVRIAEVEEPIYEEPLGPKSPYYEPPPAEDFVEQEFPF